MSGPSPIQRPTPRAALDATPDATPDAHACDPRLVRALVHRHARPPRAPETLRRRIRAALRAAAAPTLPHEPPREAASSGE
ncbi:MAG: hypothetical protein ACJ8AO_13690 [Gemmatimonadaceae bacterium]